MIKNIALKSKKIVLFLFVCFGLLSCEDVIHADLDTGEAKIVIDAEILWQKGTDGANQSIKISRMTAYYNPETPKVSGARVYVENSTGRQFSFLETAPGIYSCTDFVPVLNETYTLHVEADGQSYTATEKLIPVPQINRIEQTLSTAFGDDEYEVAVYYTDPANETNYYLTRFDTPVLPYPEYDLSNDDLTNGNETKSDFSHEDLKPGDTVAITLSGLSRQFYNYMNLILEASSSNPFSTPPANIKGNILNQNNSNSPAIGYFRLCESDYRTYTFE